jgi:histidine triad (HIT) family protein
MTCPFCARIEAGEFDPTLSNTHAVVFEPLHPVTPGHLLVVSRTHIFDAACDPWTAGQLMHLASSIARGLASANIITSMGAPATQTIRHLHLHIVPRSDDDGLALPWTGQGP